MFVGRNFEIEQLNGFYEGDMCDVAVVTGSIGVGKSTLLRHYSSDKKTFYYEAYETTMKHQLAMMGKCFGLEDCKDGAAILDAVTREAESGKVLFVIDQYPNIVKSDSAFNKLLHEYVMDKWAALPVKLVLCGDAFVLMDKYVKDKKAVWSDCIALDLCVKPMGFYEAYPFFEDKSPEECAFLYGITGGIPHNLAKIRDCADIRSATELLFLNKEIACGLNPETVMATELRELSYYNHMLLTLAQGLNRVNQISAEVEKPKDVVVPYLNSLMAIGVCTKDTAITETNNRKKTRYSIVNSSTLFWYKYIVPNMDKLNAKDTDGLWQIIEESMAEYMQEVFIRICREFLETKSEKGELPFVIEETGNWWVNDDEAGTTDGFDLVSLGKCDGKSATIFCQCYYNTQAIEVAQLKALIEKTKQLKRQGDVFYLVFSKSGFNENAITISSAIKNIQLFTLDEML